MIAIFRLAFRNALRNKRRSLLTALTVTIGTAFLVVSLSFFVGMFDGMTEDWTRINGPVRVTTTAFAEREALNPLHENIAEVQPIIERLEARPEIVEAAPVIRTGVGVTVGEELGDDGAMLVGASTRWYETRLLPEAELSEGVWLAETPEDEQVVLGARVARDVGAKVGDEVLLMGMTQYGSMAPISADVVGIITGNSSIDAQAYVTLDIARWMVDVPDGALEVLVYPPDLSDASVVAAAQAVRDELGDDYTATPWYFADLWRQSLPLIESIKYILSAIAVFIMALAVFNTMTMSVLERTGEIGVMRAMGQSRLGAITAFILESLMIGLAGSALGLILGSIPALMLQEFGMTFSQEVLDDVGSEYAISSTLHGQISLEVLVIAVLAGVLTAALGAFLPSLRAATIPPYEAMRARR